MLDMHRLGCLPEEIAEHIDVLPATVRKDLAKYLTRALDHQRMLAALNTEIDRMETLHKTYWPDAIDKNTEAAKMVLLIHDKTAKLMGLNAPEKLQVVENQYEDLTDEDIKAKIRTIEAEYKDITPEERPDA